MDQKQKWNSCIINPLLAQASENIRQISWRVFWLSFFVVIMQTLENWFLLAGSFSTLLPGLVRTANKNLCSTNPIICQYFHSLEIFFFSPETYHIIIALTIIYLQVILLQVFTVFPSELNTPLVNVTPKSIYIYFFI